MTEVASIVGAVVADIAKAALTGAAEGRRPAVRITGFDAGEVETIVASLQGFRLPATNEDVTIKVGTQRPIGKVGKEHLLGDEETLTYWRNRDVAALVLVDWDPQGDEEGLAALNRLDDQGVLADDDPDLARERFDRVIFRAWETSGGSSEAPPGRLSDDLASVRSATADAHNLSLRRWTTFVSEVCSRLATVELLTPDQVDRAVGSSLATLGLFPDVALFVEDRAVRTRLVRNVRVSGLRQPSGAAISDDDLLTRIEQTSFDEDLLTAHSIVVATLRQRMQAVVTGGGEDARRGVDLSLWLQLFERRADQAGLGQLVREHLAATVPERLDEYETLDVEAGLDHSDQEAAERLIRAEPPEAQAALVDVLAARLRRRVEKVAFPDAQIAADPLRALLHGIHVLEEVQGPVIRLGLEGTGGGPWSQWLFAFLYGKTLSEVADLAGETRRQLELDPRLVDPSLPELPAEDEDFDVSKSWAPLRLAVDVVDGGRRRFRWDPQAQLGLIAFAAVVRTRPLVRGTELPYDLDTFCERFLDPRNWAGVAEPAGRPVGPTAVAMDATRSAMLEKLEHGLTADALDDYVSAWAGHLDDARVRLVPSNAPMPELEAVVLSDVIQLTDSRLAMLASHPLRLRWIARHLRRLTGLLVKCLSEGLSLNPENTELFFEWLDRASPHGTPPFLVGPDETVAVAVREFGWHEEFAPIRRSGHDERDWLAAVDDAAIDEMVSVIVSYLDTYPYKRDGLALLLLARDGAPRVPLRVVQRLRARTPSVRIDLHVLAPRSTHHDIVRAFEDALGDAETSVDRLLPDVQLIVRHWDPETDPDLADLRDSVDVALAPALFGTRTTLNRQTRDPSAALAGGYDPWIHPATHDLAEGGQNVVRVMLPQQLDPILESWSTLCVRHDAHSAVAPQQEANTDYFALQVRFDRHQGLFAALHDVAHWVVTLDAFVGRDQVDALENRPDVILVRTGVGKNEAYTLIVSSATGRRFVVQRLERKLRFDLGFADEPPISEVAGRIYDVGRHVVPGAVLRALGLGRAANEVVGLVASRFEVARRFPSPDGLPGLEVWISFDDHQDWFGRAQRMRADLGRFTFSVDDNESVVRLRVLVVESKFRQLLDLGAAEQQLNRTTDLCGHAFGLGDTDADDAEFWRQELAAAIEQTSRIEVPSTDLPARQVIGPARVGLEQMVIQSLRAGAIVVEEVRGVAVAIASRVSDEAPPPSELGRHTLVRVNRPELERIISHLLERRSPEATHPTDPDPGRADPSAPPANDTHEPRVEEDLDLAEPADVAGEGERGAGLSVAQLRGRYERLLDVLRQHNVQVDPPPSEPWVEGPGFFLLRVVPRPGVTVDRVVNRVDEIALALALPAGSRIRTVLDRGTIVFEVPKSADERYAVTAADVWARSPRAQDRLIVPIGEDIRGDVVSIEFSSPDSPHLLVAGTTGSGKSVALETLLRGLCRYSDLQVRLQLVDPKGTELLDFADDPHTDGDIGMDATDAIAILEAAVAEMQDRYRLMRPVRARSLAEYNAAVPEEARRPWRVIVLDEYADLTSDADEKTQIEQQLRRLTQKARAAGIHVIVATQRPSADVVSTTIRSNFPAQLALRVKTATDSRIIMDESGAEALAGQGDAFLRTARGIVRVQVAWSG